MASAAIGVVSSSGTDAAPGGVRGEPLPDVDRLRDLDHAIAGRDAVRAPGAAVDGERRQAEQRALRQRRVRPRRVDRAAVDGPDLDHDIEPLVGERVGLLRLDLALVAQRQRHLLQLVVEQLLGLAEDVVVRDRRHRDGGEREQADERDEQAQPQRVHRSGAPVSMK
jgi:hypothetical protein